MNLERNQLGYWYCQFMEEILVRDELIHATILGLTPVDVPTMKFVPTSKALVAGEFCYLQLRMICELIALACLAAHNDIAGAQTSKMVGAYEADKIVKALERLHPDFYPKPTRQVMNPALSTEHGVHWNPIPIESGFLTKVDLIRLYGECGNYLHRGRIGRIIASNTSQPNLVAIKEWADKIWVLLEHHQIQTIDPEICLICAVKTKTTGRPQFSFWRRHPDSTLRFDGAFPK